MCIECVGDQEEPGIVEENGLFAVFYQANKLTDWHTTESGANIEFDKKYY